VSPEPALPNALFTLLEAGVIMYVGTRSADLEPESVIGFGLRAERSTNEITVFIAAALSTTALAHLRDNGQIAIALTDPTTNRAMQLKGVWLGERRTTEDDRAFLERYRDQLVRQLAIVGVPRSVTKRFTWWPAVALRVQVTQVFDQTPGPAAGRVCTDGIAEGRRP
jgi:hypothetical protein